MRPSACAFAAALLLAACASYDGRGLVPGQATSADVERVMGRPTEKLAAPGGGETWFFPRAPEGRDTFAARIGTDGRLASIEQTLTKENFAKVAEGKTTREQLHALLGPPWKTWRTRLDLEEWDYRVKVDMRWYDYLVDFGPDGIVRTAYLLHDPFYDAPCAC